MGLTKIRGKEDTNSAQNPLSAGAQKDGREKGFPEGGEILGGGYHAEREVEVADRALVLRGGSEAGEKEKRKGNGSIKHEVGEAHSHAARKRKEGKPLKSRGCRRTRGAKLRKRKRKEALSGRAEKNLSSPWRKI